MTYKNVFQSAIDKGYTYYFSDLKDLISDNIYIPIRMQLIELSLLQKWFRDSHKMYINAVLTIDNLYTFSIDHYNYEKDYKSESFESALLEGVKEALTLIDNK